MAFTSSVRSYLPNTVIETLRVSGAWMLLLSRVGDDLLVYLLAHCALYLLVPPSCAYQVCGSPLYQICATTDIWPSVSASYRPTRPVGRNFTNLRFLQQIKSSSRQEAPKPLALPSRGTKRHLSLTSTSVPSAKKARCYPVPRVEEGPHRQVSFTLGQAAVNLPIPASKILPDNSRAFPGLLGQGWLLKALGK